MAAAPDALRGQGHRAIHSNLFAGGMTASHQQKRISAAIPAAKKPWSTKQYHNPQKKIVHPSALIIHF